MHFLFVKGERPISRELTIIARAHDDGGKHAILSSTHQLNSFSPLRVVEEGNCPIFLGTRLFNKPFFLRWLHQQPAAKVLYQLDIVHQHEVFLLCAFLRILFLTFRM